MLILLLDVVVDHVDQQGAAEEALTSQDIVNLLEILLNLLLVFFLEVLDLVLVDSSAASSSVGNEVGASLEEVEVGRALVDSAHRERVRRHGSLLVDMLGLLLDFADHFEAILEPIHVL